MVKADAKRDYYADLELPSTADAEEIKKQFRALAKQYHPDRNPGRETEVLAKFQAVQAAHEILSDPQQKAKYDLEREKLTRLNNIVNNVDPYGFRKPPPKPGPTSVRPPYTAPQPRPRTSRSPFDNPNGRSKPPATSAGAEKLNAFTRPPPPNQTWDRAKFEEAARADAARGFASMRSSQTTPQPPPRPPRYPAGQVPFGNASSQEMPPPQGNGFPGMSRTASSRSGFDPATPGRDEPMAPRTSAYANYSRGERPQASNGQGYFPDYSGSHSPTMPKQRPTVSPLRHVRSSGFDDARPQRPPIGRESSKYATTGGERTELGGPNVGRASSVRNSPIERRWDENGPNGWQRPPSSHGPAPVRHRSESPNTRPSGPKVGFASSESSSSEDEVTYKQRPKAPLRKPRPKSQTVDAGPAYRSYAPDNPALTGQIPNTNYTKVLNEDNSQYQYPAPGSPNGPTRRPFPNMTTPGSDDPPGQRFGGIHRSETWAPKYDDPFHFNSRKWSKDWGFSSISSPTSGSKLKGLPSWAVPSSVYPGVKLKPLRRGLDPIAEDAHVKRGGSLHSSSLFPSSVSHGPSQKADLRYNSSSATAPEDHHHHHSQHQPLGSHEHHNVSQENINATFSAADWDGKFSGDEYFRPTGPPNRERRSPTRTSRPRGRSVGKGNGLQQGQDRDTSETAETDIGGQGEEKRPKVDSEQLQTDPSKAAAFQGPKFSAEEWAEKLKDQKWSIPNNESTANKSKTPKRNSRSAAPMKPPSVSGNDLAASAAGAKDIPDPRVEDPDAMDIDNNFSHPPTSAGGTNGTMNTPNQSSTLGGQPDPSTNGVDLSDLTKTAPFGPSGTGLKDLDDLATTLPFGSRAAPAVKVERAPSSLRHLGLPRPPPAVDPIPPEEKITQERWDTYVYNMKKYMHDWNIFNTRMIDHFHARQDLVNMNMHPNWMTIGGDGPTAEYYDCDIKALDGPRAGYGTYMAWLVDDAKCRAWWDEANDRHIVCLQGLGMVRENVKNAAGGDDDRND